MSTKNDSDRRRLVIGVEGMTCSSCTSTVTRALEQLPSVKNVVVSLSTNSAVLEYNSMELKATDIIKEIEDNGFDGKILQESSVPSEQKTFKKLTIGIEGMTCASCTSTVDSALKSLQSVRAVAVSLATNSATLEYDPSKISSRQIIEEVEGNGFDGKVMNETDVSAGAMHASSISANSSLRKLTLGVDGMTCSSCTSTVESALSSMKGVEEVVVSLSTNSASLLYHPNDVTPAAIVEEIESIGFEGKVLNEEAAGSSEEQYQSGTNSIEAPKSLLLTVTTSNVTSNELEEYVTRLASLAGVISASITDKEDQQITVHFHEKLTGPRKFYALAKQCQLMITISSMGSFLMATRLLKLQQREMKEQQYLLSFAIVLSIPIVFLGMILPLIPNQHFTEIMILPGLSCSSFLQFILATPIQFYIGHRFNKKALMSFKTKTFGMDFMISTGTIASYVYSVITLIKSMANPSSMNSSNMSMSGSMPSEGGGMEDTYFDTTAVLITAVLFGKYLEIYAKGRTTEAIHKLSSLRAKTARLVGSMPEDHMLTAPSHYSSIPEDELNAVNEGNEIVTDEAIMDASLLHKYDVIRLVVGEVIPADGVLLSGSNVAVNESLLTGESQLIPKKEFDFIHGGATVVEGSALLRVMNVGDETTLGKIIQTVQEAQISKPKIQEIADKIASYFVPTVMMISAITFFVWIILAAAGFVPSMWYVEISGGGGPFLLAFTFALSVWVSACPCAFGLATPTAVLVATGVAAKYGILIRKGAALQTASEIDTICFDKTGTLTKGCTEVTDCYYIDQDEQLHALPYYDEVSNEEETNTTSPSMGEDPNRRDNNNLEKRRQQQDQSVLQYFLSLFTNHTNHPKGKHPIDFYEEVFHCLSLLLLAEKRSNHPLAKGITQYCQHLLFALEQPSLLMKLGVNRSVTKSSSSASSSLPTEEELLFDIIPGQGVYMYTNPSSSSSSSSASASSLSNVQVLVGNIHLLKSKGILIPRYIEEISNGFTAGGKVSIYFGMNGRLAGILSLADKVRSETVSVLRQLQKSRKIDCYMVTGDQQSTAVAIGSSIGIETSHILAGVKPEEKELFIAALQAKGRKVAFVGDGTNDGPALARANVGIAMASGSEIAIEAGDLLLCNNHLQTLITTLDLSSFTLWRIKMNYLWAFGYNVCLIPLAAGVLYPFFHFALQPMYAGAVMALSSVSIVFSSLTITLFTPKTGNKTKDSWWWFLRNTFSFFPSATSMKQTQSQKTEKKSYDQLNRSENDIEMTEQQHTHNDQSSNCHCPVSTVSQSEDDYDDSSTGLLPRSFSDIIAETPNRIRKITRKISKNVYRKVNSTEEDLEEAEDEENHRRGKYGGSGYTARMILEDYRQQLELDQPIPVNGADGFVLPLSTMNPLMKQRGQSKKSDLITDVTGTMDAVNGLEKAMGCGCGGDNCRCYGQCKCGLRKRT